VFIWIPFIVRHFSLFKEGLRLDSRQSGEYLFYIILRLKQSLAGGQSTEPVSATRLAPVSLQGFALQILAEQLTHFIRELL
jgi:hypothetical protein